MTFRRYAIFFTPASGRLHDFASAWLGRDPAHARQVKSPDIAGLPLPISEFTTTPRRYGFHATIKAPFKLAAGSSQTELETAFAEFCNRATAVRLPKLRLARLGRFLALVPSQDCPPLDALAAETVRAFARFRAAPDETEIARRRKPGLTPRQEALLQQWGYPYVMEEFRFHMTLTDKLPKAAATEVEKILTKELAEILRSPISVDGLSLMGEDSTGMFHQIRRQSLRWPS